MKNLVIKGILAVSITSFIIACNNAEPGSAETTVDKEQIKNEIQAKEDEFAAVYNAGELRSIGYYADDAITFHQNRAPIQGKEAILEFLRSDLDSNTNTISFTTNEVFPSNDGSQVVEVGYFKLFDSAKVLINSGNYMVLFEKRNGQYVCIRDMSVSERPF